MGVIVLERGHASAVSYPTRGVRAPDGRYERDLVRAYMAVAEDKLHELGHVVHIVSHGPYRRRWAFAGEASADLYVACHLNAGGGNAALVGYDHRSAMGRRAAEMLRMELHAMPGIARSLSLACNPGGGDHDWSAMYHCISGVYAAAPGPGVCLEPAHVDQPAHLALLDEPSHIGLALARGAHRYLETRRA